MHPGDVITGAIDEGLVALAQLKQLLSADCIQGVNIKRKQLWR